VATGSAIDNLLTRALFAMRFGDLSSLYKMKHIDWLFHE